jgi:hypothetical protein
MRWTCWVAVLVGVCAAGCDVPQTSIDETTCTDLCRCISALPAGQASCEMQCRAQIAPVNDACADCVAENVNSCSAMLTTCIDACTQQQVPLQGDPP